MPVDHNVYSQSHAQITCFGMIKNPSSGNTTGCVLCSHHVKFCTQFVFPKDGCHMLFLVVYLQQHLMKRCPTYDKAPHYAPSSGFPLLIALQLQITRSGRFFYHGSTPAVGQGVLFIENSYSHSGTPHQVGLLQTSDQLLAETST